MKICIQRARYIMENRNSTEVSTKEKQYQIQPLDGRGIVILITSQNRSNALKEILVMEDFMLSSFTETSQEEFRSNFYCII